MPDTFGPGAAMIAPRLTMQPKGGGGGRHLLNEIDIDSPILERWALGHGLAPPVEPSDCGDTSRCVGPFVIPFTVTASTAGTLALEGSSGFAVDLAFADRFGSSANPDVSVQIEAARIELATLESHTAPEDPLPIFALAKTIYLQNSRGGSVVAKRNLYEGVGTFQDQAEANTADKISFARASRWVVFPKPFQFNLKSGDTPVLGWGSAAVATNIAGVVVLKGYAWRNNAKIYADDPDERGRRAFRRIFHQRVAARAAGGAKGGGDILDPVDIGG